MKTLKKTLAALATAAAFTASGSAHAYLTDWFFDPDAGGSATGVTVNEYLDIVGRAIVFNTNTGTAFSTFTFKEAAAFTSALADGFTPLGATISATFTGTGSGTISGTGGSLLFSTGTLNLFDASSSPFASFDLVTGSALLPPGAFVPNGQVSLLFKATALAPGYFFTDATKTVDLVTRIAGGDLLFGFATTNATLLTSPSAISTTNTTLAPLYFSTFGGFPFDGAGYGSEELALGNNGQYRLQIPEPGALALVGLGLFGIAGLRRRRAK